MDWNGPLRLEKKKIKKIRRWLVAVIRTMVCSWENISALLMFVMGGIISVIRTLPLVIVHTIINTFISLRTRYFLGRAKYFYSEYFH